MHESVEHLIDRHRKYMERLEREQLAAARRRGNEERRRQRTLERFKRDVLGVHQEKDQGRWFASLKGLLF
jgi:Mn-dependent DtxR family transcriptional regulator